MLYTKNFLKEARKIGVAGTWQSRSAMERKIRSLEPKERQQVKRFWQGAKMQPSQVRDVLKALKEQKILKQGATPFSILQKAKENMAKAAAAEEAKIKQERLTKTTKFYAAQRRAEEEIKEGISPRATIKEILEKRKKGEKVYETPEQTKRGQTLKPEEKKDGGQTPPSMLKEMIIG